MKPIQHEAEAGGSLTAPARQTDARAWLARFDEARHLSIVVQGSLYDWNFAESATHCAHWRSLFPQAEIILAIANTDMLEGSTGERKDLTEPKLVSVHVNNGLFQTALARLRRSCDKIVLSEGALPLPPIKFDAKTNNVNLQIVAAQAGTERASGEYILRVRSDLVFLTRDFLSSYVENYDLPRRSRCAFRQRVMISPYFTLNPFTMERLPFHYSDWFHFGLSVDVRAIWDVPEMSFADSAHYSVYDHDKSSNHLERRFRVRIAVEQFINFHSLSRKLPGLTLGHHNDDSSSEESMHILLNDFIVGDLSTMKVYFEKYGRRFKEPNLETLCVTYQQWKELNQTRPSEFRSRYAVAAESARRAIIIREDKSLKPLKYALAAKRILGRKVGNVRRGAESLLSFRKPRLDER